MPIEFKNGETAKPATEAQPYSVQTDAGSARSARFNLSEMEPPFVWFFHPRRWMLDGDGTPLPSLAKMAIEPGINGVDARGNWATARAQREQGGEVMVPEAAARATDTPDGQAGYVRRTITAAGPYFHSAWEQIAVRDGEGSIEQVDHAGYRRWLAALVQRGVIPSISDRTLTRLRETLERSLAGEVDRDTEGSKRAAAAIKRQLTGLDAWEEAQSISSAEPAALSPAPATAPSRKEVANG